MSEIPGIITKEWLAEHQECIFVFGDNLLRRGKKGAAILRDLPNTYGFITKKYPSNRIDSFFKPDGYTRRFDDELGKLMFYINDHDDKTFLISKLGSGLANKFKIWENVIYPGLEALAMFPNVIFLFKNNYREENSDGI